MRHSSLLLAACAAGLLLLARPLSACSVSGIHAERLPGLAHMLVLPSPRTVSAARGLPRELVGVGPEPDPVRQLLGPSRWEWWKATAQALGTAIADLFRPPLPYGQVVRPVRIGGADSARLASALARRGQEAVLVRWSLRADCRTALSRSREAWLPDGDSVFLVARLRPEAGWVDGRPTFDVSPTAAPYWPGRPWRERSGRLVPGLSLAQYWELFETLPARAGLEADTGVALRPLRAWAVHHPELAAHPLGRATLVEASRRALSVARLEEGRRRRAGGSGTDGPAAPAT